MSSYIHATEKWLNDCARAVHDNDDAACKHLIEQLLDPKKRDMLSTLGIWTPIPCYKCEHYVVDPDPIDPGWPMMCDETGRDMVEPYGTCIWADPITRQEN